jgi:transcription elongation GreA/GreB family factor
LSPTKAKASKTKTTVVPPRSAAAVELERLITTDRPALVASMAGQDGRDSGDVANRALQEAALEIMDARIAALELHVQQRDALEREPADAELVVKPGRVVDLSFGGGAPTRFLVEEVLDVAAGAALGDIDLLTPRSPLGLALAGKKVGDTVTVTTPGGPATVEVRAIELRSKR